MVQLGKYFQEKGGWLDRYAIKNMLKRRYASQPHFSPRPASRANLPQTGPAPSASIIPKSFRSR